ncbi:MAG: hypothetical protein ACRC0A_07735 [Chitinophagaceae bacterium]
MFSLLGGLVKGIGSIFTSANKRREEQEKIKKEQEILKQEKNKQQEIFDLQKRMETDPNSLITNQQQQELQDVGSKIDNLNTKQQQNFALKGINTSSIATQQATKGELEKQKTIKNIKTKQAENSFKNALNTIQQKYNLNSIDNSLTDANNKKPQTNAFSMAGNFIKSFF